MTTKADQRRYDAFRNVGCIVTRHWFNEYAEYDVHHIVEGYRLGNQYTIPLAIWYHRGQPPHGLTNKQARDIFGPSMFHEKRKFIQRFATERQLLELVNERLAAQINEQLTV